MRVYHMLTNSRISSMQPPTTTYSDTPNATTSEKARPNRCVSNHHAPQYLAIRSLGSKTRQVAQSTLVTPPRHLHALYREK